MLANENTVIDQLRKHGPETAGRHWAAATAEALLGRFGSGLPKDFPALLRDAERMAASAGLGPEAAAAMYAEATRMWVRLAGVKSRPGSM